MSNRLITATIKRIARTAGVSRSDVRKALRDPHSVDATARTRIEAAISQLVYRPLASRTDAGPRSVVIGVELPGGPNPFFAQILSGVSKGLEASDGRYIVVPGSLDDADGRRSIETLTDRRVEGHIAVSPLVSADWLEHVATTTPLVLLGRHSDSNAYDTVVGDDARGVALVMEHLLGLGHRRIAHLTHEDFLTQRDSGTPHSVRLAAYEQAMRSAGLADKARVLRCGVTEESAYRISRDVLTGGDTPSAIFAGHDQLALGVLRAVQEAGLTAADVAVVGYDNISLASHPLVSLTSVDQGGATLGATAVELLLGRIGGRRTAVHHLHAPALVVRASSSPDIVRS